MAASDIHRWLERDLTVRQEFVKELCQNPSAETAHQALALVKAPHGYGIYASIGPSYQYAIFGRDSIEVAEDLLESNQALAKEVILLLAHLQGCQFHLESEQESGKIHHEYRALHFNNHDIPQMAQKVLARLGPQWGGSAESMLYFGSADATPLFIRLVHRYFKRYDDGILDHPVAPRGEHRSRPLRHHVRDATRWLVSKITASPWQLFEYRRINPLGLFNQSWEDSNFSYLHVDGSVANAEDGLAAVELQGYAYDALRGAAEMVASSENEADSWRHLASIVRDTTLQRLWMPDQQYFAMGLDRADNGLTRQICTITSNPALLLETTFFDLMPHHLSWPYIEGIVRTVLDHDCLTAAGVRLRSRKHSGLMHFTDYHGSRVTWPKQTYDIAKGLRKHGLYELASLLEQCIVRSVTKAGEFYEYFYVDDAGEVKYHYRQEDPNEPTFHEFGVAGLPDPGQAWTISAVVAIANTQAQNTGAIPLSDAVRNLQVHILQQRHVQAIQKDG